MSTCPNCGYCEHCHRARDIPRPTWINPTVPTYPSYPVYTSTPSTTSVGFWKGGGNNTSDATAA